MWRELASHKRLFNPVLKAGHPGVPTVYPCCFFVSGGGGGGGLGNGKIGVGGYGLPFFYIPLS